MENNKGQEITKEELEELTLLEIFRNLNIENKANVLKNVNEIFDNQIKGLNRTEDTIGKELKESYFLDGLNVSDLSKGFNYKKNGDNKYKLIKPEFSILFDEHIVVVEVDEDFHNKYDVENEITRNLAYIKKCSKPVLIVRLGVKDRQITRDSREWYLLDNYICSENCYFMSGTNKSKIVFINYPENNKHIQKWKELTGNLNKPKNDVLFWDKNQNKYTKNTEETEKYYKETEITDEIINKYNICLKIN